MKAAAYVRVSTDDQAINGYSLEAQRDECIKHLLKRGYEHYEMYVDDGYSAKDMNRPALTRMMEDVKAKKIGYIVFWALDRLTRDTIDGLIMCRETFYKRGIPFASITEELDMDSADGEMMLTIRLSMARAERRRISERTRMGYAKRAQLGHRNSPARPYGYNVGPNIVLTVNEDEVPHLHMIYDWFIKGYGVTKIVRELNVKGIPSPRGGIWSRTAINSILRNITYIGFNSWKPKNAPEDQRIIMKGEHTPLIDEEKFNHVQDLIRRRSHKDMSRSSYHFYFSRILKCAVCGSPFYGNAFLQKGRRQTQYYCEGRRSRGACNSSNISQPKATRLILAEIKASIVRNKDISQEVSTTYKIDVTKERKLVEREISKHKTELERLVKLYMANKVDLDVYEKTREGTKDRIAELERRLEELPMEDNQQKITQAATVKLLEELEENWEYLSDQERKWLMQRLYSAIKIIKIDGKWRVEEMIPAVQ